MLDLEAEDLNSIVTRIVEQMVTEDLLKPDMKGKVMWTLLLKHRSDFLHHTRVHQKYLYSQLCIYFEKFLCKTKISIGDTACLAAPITNLLNLPAPSAPLLYDTPASLYIGCA